MRAAVWVLLSIVAVLASCHSDPPVGPNDPGGPARVSPRAAAAIVPTPSPPAVPSATPAPTPAAGATAAPTATARATATATTSPTAAPTATPLPDGPNQAGPVASVSLRLFTARHKKDSDVREGPYLDAAGNVVVYYEEILIFDVTPRNAAGQPCEAEGTPEYVIENNDGANQKYLVRMDNNNPFLLKMEVVGRTGSAKPVAILARVDGKTSNQLQVIAK